MFCAESQFSDFVQYQMEIYATYQHIRSKATLNIQIRDIDQHAFDLKRVIVARKILLVFHRGSVLIIHKTSAA